MFILFGWNHPKSENFGPVLPKKCPNCHNEQYWQLLKLSRWFTLFFIPIFPHSTEKLAICPICRYSTELDDETFESYKAIAGVNKDFAENKINEQEKESHLSEIFNHMEQKEKKSEA